MFRVACRRFIFSVSRYLRQSLPVINSVLNLRRFITACVVFRCVAEWRKDLCAMGRADVEHELSHDSNVEKMKFEVKQEGTTQAGMTSPLVEFGSREQHYLDQCFQTVWEQQITPFIVNANDRKSLIFSDHERNIRAYTYWYIASLFKPTFCALPSAIQARDNNKNASLNDNHFNLALLAEVAFAHSSNESHQNVNNNEERVDPKRKDKNFTSPTPDDNRCRRIRNNEACRKSRLRRKLMNAATKEKLVSLSQDNDELKRKIVSLEEEVRSAKNALLSKIECHSKEQLGQKLKLLLDNEWCGFDNSAQPKELEGKGSVEHMQ